MITDDLLIKVRDTISPPQNSKTIIAWELLKRCNKFEAHSETDKEANAWHALSASVMYPVGLTLTPIIACKSRLWKSGDASCTDTLCCALRPDMLRRSHVHHFVCRTGITIIKSDSSR